MTDNERTAVDHIDSWVMQMTEWSDGAPQVRARRFILPADADPMKVWDAITELMKEHGGKVDDAPRPTGQQRH